MSEDFLSRWSRRKDEARRAERGTTQQSSDPGEAKPEAARQHADDPETRNVEPALTPEEIAALPKIDELTADTDITVFLRRGVPEGLRNAALRRMWMLDPAIRDFVGHARDYAYDWNTPGGVPGSGAIQSDEAMAMVRHVFGERDAAPSGQLADSGPRERAVSAHSPGSRTANATGREDTGEGRKSAVDREVTSSGTDQYERDGGRC